MNFDSDLATASIFASGDTSTEGVELEELRGRSSGSTSS